MLKTSTMKPFEKGDIFLGCTFLNNPDDDHMGEGRILQFDKNWLMKGTLYTEGTRYLIVGCRIGPDGTLWGFDIHDHIAVRASPEGKQIEAWDSGRSFGSINWDADGNNYFGEYLIGEKIWSAKGTSAKKLNDGRLGDGNIYKYTPKHELLQMFEVDNAPEFSGFKGVTHSAMHPSGDFITYTTETGRRFMRYDIKVGAQMEDLDGYPDADPNDRNDKRWFLSVSYLDDGRLLCTTAQSLRIYDEAGRTLKDIVLPGYGWAQVCPDVDQRYALAASVWTGTAARVDLETGEIMQSIDVGFVPPYRSLAGIAVYSS